LIVFTDHLALQSQSTLKSPMNYTSVYVRSVHELFCHGSEPASDLSEEQRDELRVFKRRFSHWTFCRRIMEAKRSLDLDRSYLEVREALIHRLLRLQKMNASEIEKERVQIEHMNQTLEGLEEKRDALVLECEKLKNMPNINETSVLRCREKICEIGEEIQFRVNVKSVLMELAQSKFPDLTQGEEELEALEKHREELELIAEDLAVELNLPSGLSQMLFHYSLNNGTFSFICEKSWQGLESSCGEKELAWLHEHYEFDDISNAWRLNDEQNYFSPLKDRQLVGHRESSGISFLDHNLKKLLDEKLSDMTITRYREEVRFFYSKVCHEALSDGILTVEEIGMMKEIAGVLLLDAAESFKIINHEALRVQKNFVYSNMAAFHDLAMADGQMHREEAKFLMELKEKLEKNTISHLSEHLENAGEHGIHIKMDDESFFGEMCHLALKDKHLDERELEILMSFAWEKGWSEEKAMAMLGQI